MTEKISLLFLKMWYLISGFLLLLKARIIMSNIEKLLIYQIKKHFRLFLEIAPFYKKQNRLIFRNRFLISGFLVHWAFNKG